MHVLLTGTSFKAQHGGPARSVSGLANSLMLSGVKVGIWAPDGSARREQLFEGRSPHRLTGTLDKAFEEFGKVDIVHDSGIWLRHNQLIAREAFRRNILRVVSPRGMLEPWALNYRKWKKRVAWFSYQKRCLDLKKDLH